MRKEPSHFSMILVFACLTLLGFFFIPQLSFKLNPSRKQPVVNVSFNMSGQSPRVVEMEVTSKLEAMLNRIRGVESIHSYSGQGKGHVAVRLSEHTDPEMVRFEISTIIRQAWASLPEGVSYPRIQIAGGRESKNNDFLKYTINAPRTSAQIKEYISGNIQDKLAMMKGVHSVNVYGAGKYIYKLEYDYRLLQAHQVSVEDIQQAIRAYTGDEFLGLAELTADNSGQYIRVCLTSEQNNEKFDPSSIQVVNKGGTILRLDQLVKTRYEEEEASGFYRINGMNSIFLTVAADENANRLTLIRAVQMRLNQLIPSLPPGYEFHKTYDESEYLGKELNKIYLRSGLTLLILLVFVFAVYRNIRHSMIIILSLICNLSIASIIYYLLHIEIHLFSLAGLTISITLIIDNFIIMSDQIIRQRNRNVFLAILTATLTTIGTLSVIFFLDNSIRLNLLDFTLVVILNLTLSLIIALLLVPALIAKLNPPRRKKQPSRRILYSGQRKKRILVWLNSVYVRIIQLSQGRKMRIGILTFVILSFGIPVFLLPEQLGVEKNKSKMPEKVEDNKYIRLYNKTLGSAFYREHMKPVTNILLGGSMRLFAQKVKNGSYSSEERSETMLYANASLPNGSTIKQMDALIGRMETYISSYKEIKQFETTIESRQRANIRILFKDEYQQGPFPYILYSKLVSKALELGGGSWSVYGVGDGFNNDVKEQAGSSRIKLFGYNYDMLHSLALQLRDSLLQHRRIKEVSIASEFSWYKDDYSEFVLDIDKEKLAQANLSPVHLYAGLIPIFQRNAFVGNRIENGRTIPVILSSQQANELDIWNLVHYPGRTNQADFKLLAVANPEKSQMPQEISKENQQYKLCLQYEYIGSYVQAKHVMTRHIDNFNASAPLGYKAESDTFRFWWEQGNPHKYWLLGLVFVIIFFTSGILFNSIRQPLIILSIIPVSFIGIFLTFYFFDIRFDQGGFAAFVLLSGLSINANIYLIEEYNRTRRRHPNMSSTRAYIKAWNAKITPIFLTIFSTVIGFIPFMAGSLKESFWFPLAAGTSGGLLVSFLALFLLLPMFLGIGKKNRR